MSTSLQRLIADLKTFESRKEVLKEFKKEVRKPVPAVRRAIRARAKNLLPHKGGLGDWVSRIRINVKFKLTRNRSGIILVGGRNSEGGRTDTKAIDRGRVRAPSWGRRGAGQWHTQKVSTGFFTDPVEETNAWIESAQEAVDHALRKVNL